MNKADRRDFDAHYEDARDWYDFPECQHKHTVLLNEEGYSGKYCADCGEKLEEE